MRLWNKNHSLIFVKTSFYKQLSILLHILFPNNFIRFGSLSELMYDVEQWEAARDERLESDKTRLDEIVKSLRKQ